MASREQVIRIKMIAYTKQFRKRMKDSTLSIKNFASSTKLISAALIGVSAAFSAAGGGVLLLGAAYAKAAEVIPKLRHFFDLGRDVGVGAELFQIWALAAERAGLTTNRFGANLRFTDARIRQFRAGLGELTAALDTTSLSTQDYFEKLKASKNNDEFLKQTIAFFQSSASEADKSKVAVGLWTENAQAMLNTATEFEGAERYLKDKSLLLTPEEDERIKRASNVLADIRRETDYLASKAVATNVDEYVQAASKLEELRRLWTQLLVKVGEVAVNIADALGFTTAGKVANAITIITASEERRAKFTQEALEKAQQTIEQTRGYQIKSDAGRVRAQTIQKKLKKDLLEDEKKLTAELDTQRILALEIQQLGPVHGKSTAERLARSENDSAVLQRRAELSKQLLEQLKTAQQEWDTLNKKSDVTGGDAGGIETYYDKLIKQVKTEARAVDEARAALAQLREEHAAGQVPVEVYNAALEKLNGLLKTGGGSLSVYERALKKVRGEIELRRETENALFDIEEKLADKTHLTAQETEEFTRVQAALQTQLGMTSEGLLAQLSPLDRVLAKLKSYRERLASAAEEAAAAQQLLGKGGITPEELQQLFAPKEGSGGRGKYVWEQNNKEQTALFLKDFQSFSGQLSEAMMDAETDWDKFWLNLIKKMNQRNLARLINDSFQKMIDSLKGSNAEVVNETEKMTKNMQAATGGSGGFGWGGLITGLATVASTYYLSRKMNSASAAASDGSGGDVEVVVNINNSTDSRVFYDGRTVTDTGGIKKTVIDIIVEDYSQGGTLREVLG